MSEESETIEKLDENGGRAAIEWVFRWVFWRVNRDYDASAGHNQTVVGVLAYTYACDLFNRLSASGRFRLPDGAGDDRGRDVLRAGIPAEAFEEMLELQNLRLSRRDFAGSPGWAISDVRWILQSMPYGEIDKINWNDKSDTKQNAGRQPYSYDNPGLFDLDEYDLETLTLDDFVGLTFVLAHAFNAETGAYEVYIGHSRASDQPGSGPWHWRRLITFGDFGPNDEPGDLGGLGLPGTPPAPTAPDAAVRIRPSFGVSNGTSGSL